MDWITILGLVAAASTTVSFLPQAIKTIKTKHTKSLSLPMYLILNIGVLLWIIYGIIIKNLPVTLANIITILFTFPTLIMKLKYR